MKKYKEYLTEVISISHSVDIQDILNSAGIKTKLSTQGIEFSYLGKTYEIVEKKKELDTDI